MDQEDLTDHPFVGPAGRLLNEALLDAGVNRAQVTNVVKHFQMDAGRKGQAAHSQKASGDRGKCLSAVARAELDAVRPEVLVCMGATAARALLGREFSVRRQRGQLIPSSLAPNVMATVHPSSILRAPDPVARQQQMQEFVTATTNAGIRTRPAGGWVPTQTEKKRLTLLPETPHQRDLVHSPMPTPVLEFYWTMNRRKQYRLHSEKQ